MDWPGTTSPSGTRADGATSPTRRPGWSYHIDPLNLLSGKALWTVLPQAEREQMAIHFQLSPVEINQIAMNRRYEDYVKYRLRLEREPVYANQFTEDALDNRIESMTKLEAYLQSRQQLTCTTGNPNHIRSELERGHSKYRFHDQHLDYCRTKPTENNLHQMANVCFDERTPTIFYVRERIKLYKAARENRMDNVFKFYQNSFGFFPR